jgi:hypothetical protein
MTGRLPFTLTPLPDEPFGLWWHTYATRLGVTTTELTRAVGVPTGGPSGPDHAPAIAAATGLTTDQITGTFTTGRRCPPPRVLRIWTPQPTSRFCPSCLDEDPSWPAAWNLPLTFGCLVHNRPLAARCPACHQPPRCRPPHDPTASGRSSCPSCHHDLAASRQRPTNRPTSGAAATAQQRITSALHRMREAGATAADRRQAQNELTDITLIALHLASDSSETVHGHRGLPTLLPGAAAFTEAVKQLTQPRAGDHRLASLVTGRYHGPRIRAVPATWQAASPTLTSRIVRCRDTLLTPVERLRHATTLPDPTLPDPTLPDRQPTDPATLRATRLPDQLWPVWAIRLADDDSLDGPVFRSAMTAALLLPHSNLRLGQITTLLPHQPHPEHVTHQLRRLSCAPGGRIALRILTELALSIDRHHIPIDYPRRRRLVTETDLLDKPTWQALARGTGLHIGRRRRLDLARCYLYELLTGGSLTTAPHPYRVTDARLRPDHIEFAAAMPAPLATALTAHAERLLATAGISGEPLTWHPPTDWVTVTAWPGADPERTDPDPIHQAVLEQWAGTPHNHWAPTHAAAAGLGISSHHLREVLHRHPIPRTPYRPDRRTLIATPANGGPPHRAQAHPDHPRRVVHLDLDWLHEQYTWGRTLEDIAAEIGATRATLRNFAESHAIPRRPRTSTASIHTGTIAGNPADLPELLRNALTGRGARSRLERFLDITDQHHPSLSRAAAGAGIHQSRLTAQLHNLERACGGHLLQRRPRPQPIGPPTPLGQKLREQAHQHLDRTTQP